MQRDDPRLRKFVLGELDDADAAAVAAAIDQDPSLLESLDRLAAGDTFASRLRGVTPAGQSDPPWVADCLAKMKAETSKPENDTAVSRASGPDTAGGGAPPDRKVPVPERLGGFRVVRLLGAGGMGRVYEAVDERLGRKVALKVMSPEVAADPKAKARFVREARAAATLEHDHVVPIYHVDEADGVPFLAMPLLKGEPLDRFVGRAERLSVPAILKVGRETALGLAAAHARGLVHRDIKPGNLWLERLEDGGWRVKILDFGLARSHADAGDAITHTGGVVGTPAYMAPEQARGEKVGPTADLFSLGATLYRLSTGRPPFGSGSMMSILTALAVQNPTPVRELNPNVPPALADLIMRLLAKNPAARPSSAKDVAARLAAVESGPTVEPLAAADPFADIEADEPDSTSIPPLRHPKSRGHGPLVAACALAGVVLAIGLAVAGYTVVWKTGEGEFVVDVKDPAVETRFKQGRLEIYDSGGHLKYTLLPAEGKKKKAEPGVYRVRVIGADGLQLETEEFTIRKGEETAVRVTMRPPEKRPVQAGDPGLPVMATGPAAPVPDVPPPAAELMARRPEAIPPELLAAAGRGDSRKAPPGLVAVDGTPRAVHSGAVRTLAYSPDGRWLASAGADAVILLTDTATEDVKHKLAGHTGPIFSVAFHKDGRTLLSAATDGTLRIWQVDGAAIPRVVPLELGAVEWGAMAVSPDGRFVAAGSDSGTIRLWRYGEWEKSDTMTDLQKKVRVWAMDFDPKGELLAAGGRAAGPAATGDVYVFGTKDRKLADTLPAGANTVLSVRFSRDGTRLAAGTSPPDGAVRLWDMADRKLVCRVPMFREHSHAVDISSDLKMLAASDGDDQLQLIDVAQQKAVQLYNGNWGNALLAVTFSPDGQSLAFGAINGLVQVWDASLTRQKHIDAGPRQIVHSVALRPDGLFALLAGTECVLHRRDLRVPANSPPPVQFRSAVKRVAFAPDGKSYFSVVGTYAWMEDTVYAYDAAKHKEAFKFKTPFARDLAVSPDSKMLAVAGTGSVTLQDATTGQELHRFTTKDGPVPAVAWTTDGRRLAAVTDVANVVTVWEVESGRELKSWAVGPNPGACAFDPRGRWLATGDATGAIKLWNAADGTEVRTLTGHDRRIRALKFTADGRTLVSAANDGTVRVWNPEAVRASRVLEITTPGPETCPRFDIERSGQFAVIAGDNGLTYTVKLP